jgi:mRNA interferase RelE/StbE
VGWDYRIEEDAKGQLRDLGPSAAKEILHYLATRVKGAADPRAAGKALRSGLKGLWRYRVRDRCILCRLDNGVCIVIVIKVDHRSTVYE